MILLPTSKIKSRRKSRKVDWTWSWRRSLVDDLYSFSIIFLFAMFRFHVSLLSNCNDGYFLFKMMSSILRQRDMNFLTSIGTLCTDWHHLTLQKQTSCFQVIDPCCCFFPMHHGHSSLIFPPTIWCLFFFWPIDWSSREPMGSNCAFVRASESPEIDDLFVVEKKKRPPSKAGILDFLLLSTCFPWGNCPGWMWPKDAPGKMGFAAQGLCQRQPFVSDANAALRLKALCLEPPRVSLLKTRQTAEKPSKAGTQEMTHKERDYSKTGCGKEWLKSFGK